MSAPIAPMLTFSNIGYQLAKNLSSNSKITSVTILQDDACKEDQEPFKSYAVDLPEVKVVKAPLGDESMTAVDMQKILGEGERYDYVWDNASKSPAGAGKAVCDCAKEWGVKLFTYVSSAGMYQTSDDTVYPMAETTPVKESAGQNLYDMYAVDLGLPLVSFRPQVWSYFDVCPSLSNVTHLCEMLRFHYGSTFMVRKQTSMIILIGTLTVLFVNFLFRFPRMDLNWSR